MVVLLVLAAAAAGVVYFSGIGRTPPPKPRPLTLATYPLWCPECEREFQIPQQEVAGIERQDGHVKCPECGKFVAQWGHRPADSGIQLP